MKPAEISLIIPAYNEADHIGPCLASAIANGKGKLKEIIVVNNASTDQTAAIALFVLIRSAFIVLTHIGPFPDQIAINYASDLVHRFTFGGDLFFSAHTGLPFLMALIFWDKKGVRTFCLASAVFFGIIVLLAHLHYSIDVLAAFFITYSIYRLAEIFFSGDWWLGDDAFWNKKSPNTD